MRENLSKSANFLVSYYGSAIMKTCRFREVRQGDIFLGPSNILLLSHSERLKTMIDPISHGLFICPGIVFMSYLKITTFLIEKRAWFCYKTSLCKIEN